ncbi:hypothetical protein JOQ06_004323, partial [Pogonophryne albipinna]
MTPMMFLNKPLMEQASVKCHDQYARGEVALMLLPVMLPPPVYKQGRTLVRASVEESKRFFIDVKPVGTNMVEYLEQAKSSRSCPFVLLLEDGMLCSQAFVVISGKAIETETALAADALENRTSNIPVPAPLPASDQAVCYSIVADEAFSLKEHLMKPSPNRRLAVEQRIFNYRLSRARRVDAANCFPLTPHPLPYLAALH